MAKLTLCCLFFGLFWKDISSSILNGHMQPLGSHMPPMEIETLKAFPDALTFQHSYVQKNLPVKLKGLLKNNEVLSNWISDDYLKENFGHETVGVDDCKKENRTERGRLEMKLSEFLDKYMDEDLYMVADMPKSMAEEWPLPSFMLCGGYTENIAFVFVWLSSGGTKSVLHSDLTENLHCVVSGTKTFILINRMYADTIGSEFSSQGYFDLDVDAVDMIKYSGLATVPWYKAVIEPGDCLYLPYGWIHQVSSVGRNMGVNVWWIRFLFDENECANMKTATKGFAKIGQFPISSEIQIKGFLLDLKREDGTIHAEDILATQQKQMNTEISLEDVVQAFEIIQPGCNGILHEKTLSDIPIERYKQADTYIASVLFDIDESAAANMPKNDGQHEPMLPIIPNGGPPPEELDWDAQTVDDPKDEL